MNFLTKLKDQLHLYALFCFDYIVGHRSCHTDSTYRLQITFVLYMCWILVRSLLSYMRISGDITW